MKQQLRIVFMGTPEFAIPSLDVLIKDGYKVVGVITAPDKPAGRGKQIRQSAVKEYALKHRLKVLQPTNLNDETFIQELKSLNANLQIVVAFRMLPKAVWQMPEYGTFNLHASLLPQYRGAAPIHWAVINGEKETGVTTFFLKHEIDTGNIILQEKVTIGDSETTGELHDRLMTTGAALVLKTVRQIEENSYTLTSQAVEMNSPIAKAPKIFKEHCRINWESDVDSIHNFIRGLNPNPTAWSVIHSSEGKDYDVKIHLSEKVYEKHTHPIESIITDGKKEIKIAVKDGLISLLEIQLAGKKRMKTEELLRGFPINNDWKMS